MRSVLPGPDPIVSPQPEAGFRPLFDGTAATFKNWRLAGPAGGGMLHLNGEMVSYGDGGLRLFYYATETFGDFTLRLQFRIFDAGEPQQRRLRPLPAPDARPRRALEGCASATEPSFDPGNPAWKPVIAGFEVQIDDNARGDSGKDFYGIRPEPDGLFKNRTGAIYKIQAGDRVWHLNFNEPAVQNYTPGPALVPGVWFEYEIVGAGRRLHGLSHQHADAASASRRRRSTTPTASAAARPGSSACRPIPATPSRGDTSASNHSLARPVSVDFGWIACSIRPRNADLVSALLRPSDF